jgi:hypothetical protein
VAGHGEQETHCLVPEISSGIEHARAAAVDHGDAALAAEGGRCL